MIERRSFVALGGVAALAACTPLPGPNPLAGAGRDLRFRTISVTTTGTGYETPRAALYAADLGTDLDAALQGVFADRLSYSGRARLEVEPSLLNVADGVGFGYGSAPSRLLGTARILDTNGGVLASYVIEARVGEAAPAGRPGRYGAAIYSADARYRRLIRQFAARVRARLDA